MPGNLVRAYPALPINKSEILLPINSVIVEVDRYMEL